MRGSHFATVYPRRTPVRGQPAETSALSKSAERQLRVTRPEARPFTTVRTHPS